MSAQIISLQEHLDKKAQENIRFAHQEPIFKDRDIWGRDYSVLENVIFGLHKIHEILNWFFPLDFEWRDIVLPLVFAAHDYSRREDLVEMSREMKGYILENMSDSNRKLLTACLVVLDLIQKKTLKAIVKEKN